MLLWAAGAQTCIHGERKGKEIEILFSEYVKFVGFRLKTDYRMWRKCDVMKKMLIGRGLRWLKFAVMGWKVPVSLLFSWSPRRLSIHSCLSGLYYWNNTPKTWMYFKGFWTDVICNKQKPPFHQCYIFLNHFHKKNPWFFKHSIWAENITQLYKQIV